MWYTLDGSSMKALLARVNYNGEVLGELLRRSNLTSYYQL